MKQEVARTVQVLRDGGIIVYPTDTVWGIGCDATCQAAVERIYALKNSVNKHSMTVLAADEDMVARYTNHVPQAAWDLLALSDKPLTLILPGAHGLAEGLVPETGTVGVRIPQHEFCHAVLRALGRPIVSTSANISGCGAALTFEQIDERILGGADSVVSRQAEGHPTGKPSSIISIGEGGEFEIIRE